MILQTGLAEFSAIRMVYQGWQGVWWSSTQVISSVLSLSCFSFRKNSVYSEMDPNSLVQHWSRLSLTPVESEVAVAADRSTVERTGLMLGCCLGGKLQSHCFLTAEVMRKTFASAWRVAHGLRVEKLGNNIFIFGFDNDDDRRRVLNQGPWFFEKFLLILELPIRGHRPSDYRFTSVSFWVHFYDIPLDWYNQEMAERLGNAVGVFVEVDSRNGFHHSGSSLRLRIRVDISRPLRRGVKITLDDVVERNWIPIQYERFSEFCYFCGLIGHQLKNCSVFHSFGHAHGVVMNYGD